tara:strand:+ start:87 stop:302 length:216 start_codon:yes stop_codon:yes gene_type:complete
MEKNMKMTSSSTSLDFDTNIEVFDEVSSHNKSVNSPEALVVPRTQDTKGLLETKVFIICSLCIFLHTLLLA